MSQPAKYLLNHLAIIRVSGPQANSFLQGQLTCDVSKITPTYSSLGAHCNLKGRMVSLFRLCQVDQDYFLMMPQSIIDAALKHLQRYAAFSKVTLNAEYPAIVGIQGDAADITAQLDLIPPAPPNNTISNQNGTLIHCPGVPNRYLYLNKTDQIDRRLLTLPQQPTPHWQQYDIENQLAFLDSQTTGKFIPNEIALEKLDGVSFNKGCYLGQEIVARIHHLGQLKKKMVIIDIEGSAPLAGTEILTNSTRTCGELICTAQIEAQKYIGLALIQQAHINADLSFKSNTATIRIIR